MGRDFRGGRGGGTPRGGGGGFGGRGRNSVGDSGGGGRGGGGDRSFPSKRGGGGTPFRGRGGGDFSPRGRGGGGFTPRGRGMSPRGGGFGGGGRGFSPRGGRGGFDRGGRGGSPGRGGRGRGGGGFTPNTNGHSKKDNKMFENESDDDEEEGESGESGSEGETAPPVKKSQSAKKVVEKKKTPKKEAPPPAAESDSDEDEEEDSDDDDEGDLDMQSDEVSDLEQEIAGKGQLNGHASKKQKAALTPTPTPKSASKKKQMAVTPMAKDEDDSDELSDEEMSDEEMEEMEDEDDSMFGSDGDEPQALPAKGKVMEKKAKLAVKAKPGKQQADFMDAPSSDDDEEEDEDSGEEDESDSDDDEPVPQLVAKAKGKGKEPVTPVQTPAKAKGTDSAKAPITPNKSLFIRALPKQVDVKQLKTLCPTAVNIQRKANFAVIDFVSTEQATQSLAKLKKQKIGQTPLQVDYNSKGQPTVTTPAAATPSAAAKQTPKQALKQPIQVAQDEDSDDSDEDEEESDEDEEEEDSSDDAPETMTKSMLKTPATAAGTKGTKKVTITPGAGQQVALDRTPTDRKKSVSEKTPTPHPAKFPKGVLNDADEDDSDEDEEEDEDEQESDDEEEEEDSPAPTKAQKRKAAPVDGGTDNLAKQMRVGESMAGDLQAVEEDRRARQQACSLYISHIPRTATTAELQKLHADIISVRRPSASSFAFLLFADERGADRAHAALSKMKMNGKDLKVDFCGAKSAQKAKSAKATPKSGDGWMINPWELYVGNLPANVKLDDMKAAFPTADTVKMPPRARKAGGFAFVQFNTTQSARAAFDAADGMLIGGVPVVVSYARMGNLNTDTKSVDTAKKTPDTKAKQPAPTKTAKAAAKAQPAPQEESDDDEEDEESGDDDGEMPSELEDEDEDDSDDDE